MIRAERQHLNDALLEPQDAEAEKETLLEPDEAEVENAAFFEPEELEGENDTLAEPDELEAGSEALLDKPGKDKACKDDSPKCKHKKIDCLNILKMKLMHKHCRKSCGLCREKVSAIRPVACEWYDWQEWGACDESCGIGSRIRRRGIAQHAYDGGDQCEGPPQQSQDCNDDPCPTTTTYVPVKAQKVHDESPFDDEPQEAANPQEEPVAAQAPAEKKKSPLLMYGIIALVAVSILGIAFYVVTQVHQKKAKPVQYDEFGEVMEQEEWEDGGEEDWGEEGNSF
jgi:hypothetical protein